MGFMKNNERYRPLCKLYYTDKENYEGIYQERYHANNALHFDMEINGHPAFMVASVELFNRIIDIYRKDKEVLRLCGMLPGVALKQFAQRCLIDEIVISNNIEGVNSSRQEISDVLAEAEKRGRNKRYKGLVRKYAMLQSDRDIRFQSCGDIRAVYDELVSFEIAEDDPDNLPDGQIFRKDSTSVMSPAQKEIHRGLSPESRIIEAMDGALNILNDESVEMIIRIAVFHYLFGYIHPFYDGNGRTSRFISSSLLARSFEPLLGYRLSYTIKDNLKAYYDAFQVCNDRRSRGDLTPFVNMFADIVNESVTQLIHALEKRIVLLEKFSSLIKELPMGDDRKYYDLYSLLIQAGLFADRESGISLAELSELMNVSSVTAAKRLNAIDNRLLIINKQGNTNLYRINTDVLDEMLN